MAQWSDIKVAWDKQMPMSHAIAFSYIIRYAAENRIDFAQDSNCNNTIATENRTDFEQGSDGNNTIATENRTDSEQGSDGNNTIATENRINFEQGSYGNLTLKKLNYFVKYFFPKKYGNDKAYSIEEIVEFCFGSGRKVGKIAEELHCFLWDRNEIDNQDISDPDDDDKQKYDYDCYKETARKRLYKFLDTVLDKKNSVKGHKYYLIQILFLSEVLNNWESQDWRKICEGNYEFLESEQMDCITKALDLFVEDNKERERLEHLWDDRWMQIDDNSFDHHIQRKQQSIKDRCNRIPIMLEECLQAKPRNAEERGDQMALLDLIDPILDRVERGIFEAAIRYDDNPIKNRWERDNKEFFSQLKKPT